MSTFLDYIRAGKTGRVNAIIEMALKEKTLAVISEEKMRVAATLLDEDIHHHPLHYYAKKHGYEHKGPGVTTTGGSSTVHRQEYEHPETKHRLTLGTVHNDSKPEGSKLKHFWSHESHEGKGVRHHGITSDIEPKKLKYSLDKHLAGKHHSAKMVAAFKKHHGPESVREEIQNPNSSGQGHDPEHHMHPHHATILKHGYEYSHSTPVSHSIPFSSERERINHHTYKLKGHPDHNVSVHYSPKMEGNHKWEVGKTGGNTSMVGRSTEALDKHLKGHVARAKRAAAGK